jgi:hypothetical protein
VYVPDVFSIQKHFRGKDLRSSVLVAKSFSEVSTASVLDAHPARAIEKKAPKEANVRM